MARVRPAPEHGRTRVATGCTGPPSGCYPPSFHGRRFEMAERTQVLSEYVNDMLAVESDLHAMLRRHKNDARIQQFGTAKRLMDQAEEAVDRHLTAIQRCADRL